MITIGKPPFDQQYDLIQDSCGNCKHHRRGDYCAEGHTVTDPDDWCKYWTPKPAAPADAGRKED